MSQNYHQIQQTNIRQQSTISPIFFVEEEQNSARHLSIIPQVYYPLEEDFVQRKSKEYRRILFIFEPIIIGLILFPIVVLFWQCGWNLVLILLDLANRYPLQDSGQSSGMEESKTLADSPARKEYLSKFDRQLPKIENPDSLILNLEEGDYSVYYCSNFSPLFLSWSRFFLQFSEETN